MGRKLLVTALASATVAAGLGAFATSANAGGFVGTGAPAGENHFITDPQGSYLDALPLGGLFPGCTIFNPELHVAGGLNGGPDTIVRRNAAVPGDPPPNHEVPIEIVALNLVGIEPLTVQCGNEFQNWFVEIGLSEVHEQLEGLMRVNKDQPDGGLLGGELPVLPRLVFTRVDAGAADPPRVVDVGQGGPGAANNFRLFYENWPFRFGPCLNFPLNGNEQDGLCVGQHPGGSNDPQLVPFQGEANFIRHEAYPSHSTPEHLKCYAPKPLRGKAKRKSKFGPVSVKLFNQFGLQQTKAKKRAELCNPAQKLKEPWVNRAAHQQCYQIGGKPLERRVNVANQFGVQGLIVGKARRLCVPTQKQELPGGSKNPIKTPIEHQTCYDVKIQTPLYNPAGGPPGKLRVKDQFTTENVKLRGPKWLCAPTDKNDEGLLLPLQHQVCYAIKGKNVRAKVKIKNQFESKKVKYKKPKLLCVPSYKQAFDL